MNKWLILILKIYIYTIILKNARMLLRIFCIAIHYLLHLATCLHAVNLCAHNDSSYIMIYMHTFMKKEYPGLALNKKIIYHGHR